MEVKTINWLLIAVVALLLLCVWRGYKKGFMRMFLSMTSWIISIILVSLLLPFVSDGIYRFTGIDESISQSVESRIDALLPDTDALMERAGISREDLSAMGIPDSQIEEYLNGSKLTRAQQAELINQAPVPNFLRDALNENNNSEIYSMLGVDNFKDYIVAYLTRMVIRVIAFFVTLLLVWLLVKMLFIALDKVTDLPLLNSVNRFFGGVLGVVWALLLVWSVFLVLALVCTTEAGKGGFSYIESSRILTILYDYNPLLHLVMQFGK